MTDDYIRPDVAAFLTYLNNVPGPKMHEIEPAAARAMMVAMRGVADADVGELAVIRDLMIPGPVGQIPARLFDAREHRLPGPVTAFFHGGGFVIGDLDTHAPYCAEAARVLDMPVIAIEYRLAPEHKWPAAPDDCETATRWIATSPPELGLHVTSLVLSGDSAGGNLTIITAMALRDTPARVPVIVQAPLYPAVDGTEDWESMTAYSEGHFLTADGMRWFNKAYAPDLDHPRAHPLAHTQAGMPPTLVITASLDPLRDQGRAYVAALANAGVPVTFREAVGNVHGFINLRRGIPSSAGDIAGFLATLKPMILEAEGARVMAQAAGA